MLKSIAEDESAKRTITVQSYKQLNQNGITQIITYLLPWVGILNLEMNKYVLFIYLILICLFFIRTDFNNSNYNPLCAFWGYRYYEVITEENTYILLTKDCIKDKFQIKYYKEITDYIGIIK